MSLAHSSGHMQARLTTRPSLRALCTRTCFCRRVGVEWSFLVMPVVTEYGCCLQPRACRGVLLPPWPPLWPQLALAAGHLLRHLACSCWADACRSCLLAGDCASVFNTELYLVGRGLGLDSSVLQCSPLRQVRLARISQHTHTQPPATRPSWHSRSIQP